MEEKVPSSPIAPEKQNLCCAAKTALANTRSNKGIWEDAQMSGCCCVVGVQPSISEAQ